MNAIHFKAFAFARLISERNVGWETLDKEVTTRKEKIGYAVMEEEMKDIYKKKTWRIWECIFFLCNRPPPQWARASSFTKFLDHTQRRTTVGRTPLDEWSARRRDLHLTTHNNHNRQKSMPPVGLETTISAGERPQTYALERAATGTGIWEY